VRILIVIPRQPQATGNYVTAERQRHGLENLGHTVRLLEVEPERPQPLAAAIASFRPNVALLLHAWRSGHLWRQLPAASTVPYAVSLTGTDLNEDLATAERGPLVRQVLQGAGAIVTQNPLTAAMLRREGSPWATKLHLVPPAVVLGSEPFPLRERLALSADSLVLLHPAGIRPVKCNLELLLLCDDLATEQAAFSVVFCGPQLDPDYAARFQAALADRPWARYLGVVPPQAMAAVLLAADVVLNHSQSEGLPNALLEAAVLGRPILARDIPGNAAVVRPDENGLLYRSDDEFRRHARALLADPVLRRRLAVPAPEAYRPAGEARALEALLRPLVRMER
jgi:glycosyltransferase involved in cell wall biosynthesis